MVYSMWIKQTHKLQTLISFPTCGCRPTPEGGNKALSIYYYNVCIFSFAAVLLAEEEPLFIFWLQYTFLCAERI